MHKLYGKWDFSEIEIKDPSIRNYVNLAPIFLPHSGGKNSKKQFAKSTLNIVERLVNKMMREEHNTAQKITVNKTVKNAFDIITKKPGQHPVQVLVNAIANAGPREDTVRLQYRGRAVPQGGGEAP